MTHPIAAVFMLAAAAMHWWMFVQESVLFPRRPETQRMLDVAPGTVPAVRHARIRWISATSPEASRQSLTWPARRDQALRESVFAAASSVKARSRRRLFDGCFVGIWVLSCGEVESVCRDDGGGPSEAGGPAHDDVGEPVRAE